MLLLASMQTTRAATTGAGTLPRIIDVDDINSAAIRQQAKLDGISTVQLLETYGAGDDKVDIYQFGEVRVADTNGDPVWEEQDTTAFSELIDWAKSRSEGTL